MTREWSGRLSPFQCSWFMVKSSLVRSGHAVDHLLRIIVFVASVEVIIIVVWNGHDLRKELRRNLHRTNTVTTQHVSQWTMDASLIKAH